MIASTVSFLVLVLMKGQIGFIVKVLLLSASFSIFIKYSSPVLSFIAPTQNNALIGVFVPFLFMVLALGWRTQKRSKYKE